MATIRDVANRAQVSNSTVSNVLNGRTSRMTSDTLARVQQAMAELGYNPSFAARSLKTGQSALIGLLVPSTANPWFGEIAARIEHVARDKYDCHILLGNTQRDVQSEARFIGSLQSFGVRGLIVMSALADESHLLNAARQGMAVVSYDRRASGSNASIIDHVTVDNHKAGALAAAHLIDKGHRRLAFVSAFGRTVNRVERISGFLETASARDAETVVVEADSSHGFADDQWAALGEELAAKLLREHPDVTGIVTVNGTLAISLTSALRERGFDVPRDFSVVGIDDMPLSTMVSPAMTSIRIPTGIIAESMVDRVMARCASTDLPPGETVFEPTLIERRSVAAPRTRRLP